MIHQSLHQGPCPPLHINMPSNNNNTVAEYNLRCSIISQHIKDVTKSGIGHRSRTARVFAPPPLDLHASAVSVVEPERGGGGGEEGFTSTKIREIKKNKILKTCEGCLTATRACTFHTAGVTLRSKHQQRWVHIAV